MFWRRVFVAPAICLAIALLVAGCNKATPPAQASVTVTVPSEDPAASLVGRFKMGAGLESLANQVAGTTTTFATLAQKHGVAGAQQLVKDEISKVSPSYQGRWDQNLASIYSKHFSAEELRSLAAQGTSSPHVEKFRSTHAVVAAEMRVVSGPLLQQLVTEALSSAVKQQ